MDSALIPERAAAPAVADAVQHSLDPRVIRVQRVGGWITAGVVAAGLAVPLVGLLVAPPVPSFVKVLATAGWAALCGILGWWLHRWPAIAYRHTSYRVDGAGIEIRRGVVWRRILSVPRSRVQHTDVSQGPLERTQGLGTLIIYTAGTEYARVELAGLEHQRALAIRDYLLPRGSDDAV